MRADRLVSILLWLQVHGVTPTAELARRFEVSRRTIHRDMDALSAAGIPVYALRGRNGGWALPDAYRGSARWLSADEVRSLAVLSPAQVLTDLGLGTVAEAAWLKLLTALPPPHRDEAARIQARLHVDTGGWRPRDEPAPWLPVIKQAVFDDRLVRLRYRRADGSGSEPTLAPLGLVARGPTWYVVAETGGELRTYRVSRIESAELLDERFRRPEGFDLAAAWAASKATLVAGVPRYPVTLRVEAGAIDALRGNGRWGRVEHVGPADRDGWREVAMLFERFDDARATALSLGPRAEVVAPAELRAAVVAALQATLARYDRQRRRDARADPGDNVNSELATAGPAAAPRDDTA